MRLRKTGAWPAPALLTLLVLLGTTGCGSGGAGDTGVATAGGATPGATASGVPGQPDVLRFARCMRANGVPGFQDPSTKNGGLQLMLPQGTDPQTGRAAMEKCKQYLPDGGVPSRPDPQFLARMCAYASCMRAHGVPNFPDPDPNGGMVIDSNKLGMKPDDPAFKAADQACASSRPSQGGGQMLSNGAAAPGGNG